KRFKQKSFLRLLRLRREFYDRRHQATRRRSNAIRYGVPRLRWCRAAGNRQAIRRSGAGSRRPGISERGRQIEDFSEKSAQSFHKSKDLKTAKSKALRATREEHGAKVFALSPYRFTLRSKLHAPGSKLLMRWPSSASSLTEQ